jgi:cell fate (sporulation/competence/biofilm development) regulator YlbF (YheA/YmcA/DUF963 family)
MAHRAGLEAVVDREMGVVSEQNNLPALLLEAASVLAENLVQSEPFLRWQEAERMLNQDKQAQHLLSEFFELRQKVWNGQPTEKSTESDLKRLRELQNAILDTEVIQENNQAQKNATAFLQEVNQAISGLLGIDFSSLTRRSGGCC